VSLWKDCREVEECARHRCDRNATDGCDLIGLQRELMNADSAQLPPAPVDGDLEAIERPELPNGGSRTVAGDSAGTSDQHSGKPAPVRRNGLVPNHVDAPVHGVQAAAFEPVTNCLEADPRCQEILSRNHSVLALRERRDQTIYKLTARL
jgi:hypothetical protein